MYLVFLTIVFCLTYVALQFLYGYLFGGGPNARTKISPISIGIIAIWSVLSFLASASIEDDWISNRLLHALGGGFLGIVTCFLAARDGRAAISRFQFFVFGILVVTALGVGNEIMEFMLQMTTDMIFATGVFDTWLDLVSNTVGALAASAVLLPFIRGFKT